MSHHIVKCRHCKAIIQQCRCPASDKPVRWGLCAECTGGEAIVQPDPRPTSEKTEAAIGDDEFNNCSVDVCPNCNGSVAHVVRHVTCPAHEDQTAALEAQLQKATEELERTQIAGTMLSNTCYNLAQREHLTDSERRSCRESYKAWDARRSAPSTTTEPREPDNG